MIKIIVLLSCIIAASCGYVHKSYTDYAGFSDYNDHDYFDHHEHYDEHPEYKFSYGVDDLHTGDSKNHFEERKGDVVNGEYTLIDPDGFKRVVKYTADPHNGFNAVVHREPLVHYAKPLIYNHHDHSPYSHYYF